MTRKPTFVLCVLFALMLSVSGVTAQGEGPSSQTSPQVALGTAFTYQGQLKNGSGFVTGPCDFQFGLWDLPTLGTQSGVTQSVTSGVTNGLFTVSLNGSGEFGGSAFTGSARFLQIAVKCGSDSGFTAFSSRQALTPTPYALYASSAGTAGSATTAISATTASSVAWSGVSGVPAPLNFLANPSPCSANQVATWNGTTWTCQPVGIGTITGVTAGTGLSGGGSSGVVTLTVAFAGSGSADTAARSDHTHSGADITSGTVSAAYIDATIARDSEITPAVIAAGFLTKPLADASYWTLNGNGGTTASNFIGTTDNMTLTLAVSNSAALRLVPNATSPNIIAGYRGNVISATVVGGAIGGGGASGNTNRVTDDYGVVAGGGNNRAGDADAATNNATYATVGGGYNNTASSTYATVGGGSDSIASGPYATVGGGANNNASGLVATVGGGAANAASGQFATIGGGSNGTAVGNFATVGGGYHNTANGIGAFVGGGGTADGLNIPGNHALGNASTIGGGVGNNATFVYATVGGGWINTASGQNATVGGGYTNTASGQYATVGGGAHNIAFGDNAIVGGGYTNTASGQYATVGGGVQNIASGDKAIVGGGNTNTANGYTAIVGGGWGNIASGDFATVGGGASNTAGSNATVGGGGNNAASGGSATVAGGQGNTASGGWATVPGGTNNLASGSASFAAGTGAKAVTQGAFVWADNTGIAISSTVANEFLVRASGGITLYTDAGATNGAALYPGAGSWSFFSDRNLKANVRPLDPVSILNQVAALPVQTWNYTTQDESIRHIGPMAQDFYAAFNVGENNTTISTVDAQGVAFAAIQGLYLVVHSKDTQISTLQAQVDAQAQELVKLKELVEGKAPLTSSNSQNILWFVAGGMMSLLAFGLGRRGKGGVR